MSETQLSEQMRKHSRFNHDWVDLENAEGYADQAIDRMETPVKRNPDNAVAAQALAELKASRQNMEGVLEELLR